MLCSIPAPIASRPHCARSSPSLTVHKRPSRCNTLCTDPKTLTPAQSTIKAGQFSVICYKTDICAIRHGGQSKNPAMSLRCISHRHSELGGAELVRISGFGIRFLNLRPSAQSAAVLGQQRSPAELRGETSWPSCLRGFVFNPGPTPFADRLRLRLRLRLGRG